MSVEEGYYYFFSTKDPELEKFRSFQNIPNEHLIPNGDICYYQFRKSQKFYRVNDLFNEKNITKLNSDTYTQIHQNIKCFAENIFENIKIIPDMELENTFIQLQKIKIKGRSQLILSQEETAINVIFMKQSRLVVFQDEVENFERNYLKYSEYFSLNLSGIKHQLYKLSSFISNNGQSSIKDNGKPIQTFLTRNIQDSLKNFQDEQSKNQLQQIFYFMQTHKQFKYIDQDIDFTAINDIKSLFQQNKLQLYDKLQQLQSYCLTVSSIKEYPLLFQEIKSYLVQVQIYLSLNENFINIEITAINIMGGILMPCLRSENTIFCDYKQILKFKEQEIKDYIFSIIKKKINDL